MRTVIIIAVTFFASLAPAIAENAACGAAYSRCIAPHKAALSSWIGVRREIDCIGQNKLPTDCTSVYDKQLAQIAVCESSLKACEIRASPDAPKRKSQTNILYAPPEVNLDGTPVKSTSSKDLDTKTKSRAFPQSSNTSGNAKSSVGGAASDRLSGDNQLPSASRNATSKSRVSLPTNNATATSKTEAAPLANAAKRSPVK
jgi:hypothetical protein